MKYERKCVECALFRPHSSLDWTYGRCKLTGNFAENELSRYGDCKGGKKWKPLNKDIELAEKEANEPFLKKLIKAVIYD